MRRKVVVCNHVSCVYIRPSLQIDDLTRKNKALGEQLRLATAGWEVDRRNTVPGDRKGGECLVLGESIIRIVGTECSDMKTECFPGIRIEQPNRVIENRDLGNTGTVNNPCRYKRYNTS